MWQGRADLALAFNRAVREGRLSAPVVISRDHHDVSGTDSPFRETTSVTDGSRFCAGEAAGLLGFNAIACDHFLCLPPSLSVFLLPSVSLPPCRYGYP